jgi:hypothetical protein
LYHPPDIVPEDIKLDTVVSPPDIVPEDIKLVTVTGVS